MPIEIKENIVRLENQFCRRHIDISNGPFCRDVFTRSPENAYFCPHHHLNGPGIPFEAAVKLGGKWLEVGINRHLTEFWQSRGSVFHVARASPASGRFGPAVILLCRPPPEFQPQLDVEIEYELCGDLPFLRKSVRVTNRSSQPVEIQNVAVEIFYPVRIDQEIVFLHDFRRDVRCADEFYMGYQRFQFPFDINTKIGPGETLESFNLYEVFTPNHPEGRAVWTQRVLKRIAPWITESYISLQCGSIRPRADISGPDQFFRLAAECADVGIEKVTLFVGQCWSNTGDYDVRRDLFPEGEKDLRRVVARFHELGLKLGAYTSYSIACHDTRVRTEHLDWECIGADGQRFYPAGLGNMCFLSGWGDWILERYRWMLREFGFDEIFIDGPTDIPCYARGHKHHNEFDYEYLNWQWEKSFFRELRDRGVYIDIPRCPSYLLMGACCLPAGYTEEDFCHCTGMEQIVNCRSRLYQARYHTPACATYAMLVLDPYHRHFVAPDEDKPWLYEQNLASLFGYGHLGALYGSNLYAGPKTKALLVKWITFTKLHRRTLAGDFVHILPPDGAHPDAVLHTNPQAEVPAVAVFINPAPREQKLNVALPLHYAGFRPGGRARNSAGAEFELDERAAAAVALRLGPYEARTMSFFPAE